MIVVVDCSLSMAGGRELLAKAIVLEAAVRAQRQARRCFLLSYGGAEELTTLEVDACTDPGTLFDFALRTFHGHTDTSDVLRVVLNRVLGNFGDGVDVWRQADVLWLSDGEWSMREGLLSDLAKAKERGTRFVGCLIGAAEAGGMEALCDELHRLGLETLRRSQVQAAEHRRA